MASSSFKSLPTSINTGKTLTLTIKPADSKYRHRVKFVIDGASKHTSGFIAAGTTTYSYDIPHSWIPTGASKTMKVYLYTYAASGSNYIARISKDIIVNVPSNIKPSISSVEAEVLNGLDGKYVHGKSQVRFTISAKPGDGSSLKSYTFKGANIAGTKTSYTSTSDTKTSSKLQTSGKLTYTFSAKDGRRSSSTFTKEIYVYPYAAPQVTSIKAQRCDKSGVISNNGTYAKVTVKISYSAIDGANKRVVKLYSSEDNFLVGDVVLSKETTDTTYTGVYGGNFATNKSYTIKAVITDEYTTGDTASKSATILVSERTMNIAPYGNGVAIGGLSSVTSASSAGKFECNWDSTFSDNVRIKHTGAKCFEFIRAGIADDIDNDGTNELADIQGQIYVNDSGNVTFRRRYSTDNGNSYYTQGYWQLRNNDMHIVDNLTVSGAISSSESISATGAITTDLRFGCTSAYSNGNFNIYCQWKDGENHDILVRSSDGLTVGLGWVGNSDNTTVLDIRPQKVNIRGTVYAPCGRFTATTDIETGVQHDVALRVGSETAAHLDIDGNEIQAKNGAKDNSNLFLNNCGGDVYANGWRIHEVQSGTVSITPSAPNTPTSKVVKFDKAFSSNPVMTASPHTSVPGTTVLGVGTANRSKTEFTMWVTRSNTTATSINWIAVC